MYAGARVQPPQRFQQRERLRKKGRVRGALTYARVLYEIFRERKRALLSRYIPPSTLRVPASLRHSILSVPWSCKFPRITVLSFRFSFFFPSCRQYRFSSDSFNPRARDIARTWNIDTRRWELQVEVEECDERTRWTRALRGCRKKQLIWDVWCFELEFCYLFRFARTNQGS